MDIPIDSFTAVKLMRTYKDKKKVTETGIYYNTENKSFDCWYVAKKRDGTIRNQILVVQIAKDVAFEGGTERFDIYKTANKHLADYAQRSEDKNGGVVDLSGVALTEEMMKPENVFPKT